ncbi:transposase [Isosphaeraceae bacterium EP7]
MGRRGLAADQKKARDERAHVVLIDESGFFLNPTLRRTWAPRGRTPVLTGFGRHRDKVSTIAAISVAPRRRRVGLYWRTDPAHYIDGAAVVAFLRDLLRHLRGAVVVIWGGGSNHKGPLIRTPLSRYPRLHLERLPAYAPDLNPVEFIWGHLKHGLKANFVPRDVHDLDRVVNGHLERLGGQPAMIRSLWRGSNSPSMARTWRPDYQ